LCDLPHNEELCSAVYRPISWSHWISEKRGISKVADETPSRNTWRKTVGLYATARQRFAVTENKWLQVSACIQNLAGFFMSEALFI
jgi:hypothetical protein